MKKKFKVAVEWVQTATMEFLADDLDEAKEMAYDADLPKDGGEYLDESFRVNDDLTDELNPEDEDDNEPGEEEDDEDETAVG